MAPGEAELPLRGRESNHGLAADRLEAFARPCVLFAFWLHSLQHRSDPGERARAERAAAWLRAALVLGTDPKGAKSWGPDASFHQHGVEMGLLAVALEVARPWLWDPLEPAAREQVARWMASNRGAGHHWNNHFFFGIFCLEFLESTGFARPADRPCIDHWFEEMETMYRSQGWFMDGVNLSYDHYNAYAFHFYGPLWAYLYGDRDPARRERWLAWAREFLESYQHVFAPSGEHPAFGRSITYRFNASAPFSAAQLVGANPLPPGRSRRLCTRNLDFFLERPIRQEQGVIGLGWTDVFPRLAEPYSCAGSVYWGAKAFVALLIPPEDPFWTEPESPLVSEAEPPYTHLAKAAGLIVRKVEDGVEILNAGTAICQGNKDKFGAYKWGKLAYRTHFAFTLGSEDHSSRDLGMTARDPRTGRVFGRHYTVPLEMTETHLLTTYSLGDLKEQCAVSVESLIAWRGSWLLQLHRFESYQAVELAVGGYALPLPTPVDLAETLEHDSASAAGGGCAVQLQVLGRTRLEVALEGRLDETTARTHVAAPFHRTPVASRAVAAGETGWIAVLVQATTLLPWSAARWSVEAAGEGAWHLRHPHEGEWRIEHPALPSLDAL